MKKHTSLLIVGAGPFGLAMAAYAKSRKIDHVVVGRPMAFWTKNMPEGMLLRSACNWHLDTDEIHTIKRYLQTLNLTPADVRPLSLGFYLGYVKWFQEQKNIEVTPAVVERLDHEKGERALFKATLSNGEQMTADRVLLAVGFQYFKSIPQEISDVVPRGRFTHTCDFVDLSHSKDKRFLIIGGRQSAFEWAALLCENGARTVHVSHRHETPDFTKSDWSWVPSIVNNRVENPGWFRQLSVQEKEEATHRLWAEGRLRLEPWLWLRVNNDRVKIWPKSNVAKCSPLPTGELKIELDSGDALVVDHVVLATGYKVEMKNIPFLAAGNVLPELAMENGFPKLDEHMQTNIPGLFSTSLSATQDFGPYFGFTVSVVAATKIVGNAL